MTTTPKNVTKGKYTFQITDNTILFRDEIYCRNIKIGGINVDCVNVSIFYKNNLPDIASIPYIMYDPYCSIGNTLDKGNGTILMIETLLEYIQKEIPSIKEIHFEDKSNIECATEYEIQKKGSRFRKKGTHVYPIPLYYFSIAFNGETWYEKYFNARQKDRNKHDKYRAKIDNLYSEELKTNTSFLRFLEIAQPPVELIDELEHYYNKSGTFKDFFQSIPKPERCKLTRDWISTFMSYHLKDVFENTDWLIDLIDEKGAGRRKTRKYYCPTGFIMHNKTYKDFGIDIISF